MARIRPVTPLNIPNVRIVGVGTVNNGTQTLSGSGALPIGAPSVFGTAVRHAAVGQIQGSGAISTKRMRVTNGAAAVIKHSRGPGVVTTKKIVAAGTAIRLAAFSAVVVLLDSNGNPAGYGPTEDPEGVFFGDTSLLSGDVWWPTNPTANVAITGFAGGTWHAFSSVLNPGAPASFTVNLRRAIGGARSSFVKNLILL
jgi:hypothetical protein